MPYCSNCGFQTNPNDHFCRRCGMPLDFLGQSLREKEQAKQELTKIIQNELSLWGGKWMQPVFFALTILYAVVLSFLFYSYFVAFRLSIDYGFPIKIWTFLVFFIPFLQITLQYKSISEVNRNVKKGLIVGAQSLVNFYEQKYKIQKYIAAILLISSLSVVGTYFAGVYLGYWLYMGFAVGLYVFLLSFALAYFLFSIYWFRKDSKNKKTKILSILSKLQ